jgi:hypothetical protein
MHTATTTRTKAIFPGILLLFLSACTTTLAPPYDQAIMDGLNDANANLMVFFASTTSGTSPQSFDEREERYNTLIGSLDALVIQSRARPMPKNDITEAVNAFLEKRGAPSLVGGEAPSASAIAKISETMTKMRDTDKKQGVTAFEVSAFRGQVVIYLDQALTYETFLKR